MQNQFVRKMAKRLANFPILGKFFEIVLLSFYLFRLLVRGNESISKNTLNLLERAIRDAGETNISPRHLYIVNRDFLSNKSGGVNFLCAIWAGGFAARGHRVTIVCEGRKLNESRSSVHENLNICTLRPKFVLNPFRNLPPYYESWNSAVQDFFYEKSMKNAPSINLLSTIAGLESFLQENAERINNICYLVTDHKIHQSFQGKSDSNQQRLKRLVEVERHFLKSTSVKIVADSHAIKKDLALELRLPELSTLASTIPIGWPENYVEIKIPLDYEKYFLYVGSISHRKGIKTLLESWKSVVSLDEFANISLIICGSPSDDHNSLKFLSEQGKKYRITYFQEITEEQKLFLIRKSIAVIVPSNYESFGIVALEAFQQGKTVLGSRCGGLKDLIRNEDFMFEPGNPNELSMLIKKTAIGKLRLDEKEAFEIASHFQYRRMLESFEALFA